MEKHLQGDAFTNEDVLGLEQVSKFHTDCRMVPETDANVFRMGKDETALPDQHDSAGCFFSLPGISVYDIVKKQNRAFNRDQVLQIKGGYPICYLKKHFPGV